METARYTADNPSPYNLRFVEDCINAALRNDSGLNTPAYRVDMSKVAAIPAGTISAYFLNHPAVSPVILDTLFKKDSLWIKYDYFDKVVIRFEKIEQEGDRIRVIISKYKATDGSIGVEVTFRKTTEGYIFVSARITWIS